MEIPRSGLAGAVTCTPAACSRSTAPFQLEASAKAPCTSTTVNGAAVVGVASVMIDSSWVVTTDGPTSEAAPCTSSRDTTRPVAAMATAALALASSPMADLRQAISRSSRTKGSSHCLSLSMNRISLAAGMLARFSRESGIAVSRPTRLSIRIDVDDSLSKGLRGFLGQVVPDTSLDNPMRIGAREFPGIGTRLRVWRAIGITFERDGRDGDHRARRQPLFQIVKVRLTVSQPEPPAVVMDDDGDVIRVVERRRAALERGIVEVPL